MKILVNFIRLQSPSSPRLRLSTSVPMCRNSCTAGDKKKKGKRQHKLDWWGKKKSFRHRNIDAVKACVRHGKFACVVGLIDAKLARTIATYFILCFIYLICSVKKKTIECIKFVPWSSRKPLTGTREVPVANWSRRVLFSESSVPTNCQNHLITSSLSL